MIKTLSGKKKTPKELAVEYVLFCVSRADYWYEDEGHIDVTMSALTENEKLELERHIAKAISYAHHLFGYITHRE